MQWATWADGYNYEQFHNNLTILPFLQTVADMNFWWIMRGIGGVIILAANILFVINIYNTIVLEVETEPVKVKV